MERIEHEAWVAPTVDELHRLYLDRVFAYVFRRLPERAEAEDITAETFAAAFGALPRLRVNSDPALWLLGIARKKLADHQRRRRRRPEEPLTIELVSGDAPAQQALLDERRQVLWRLLDTLNADAREALLLQHLENLSIAEIAQVLGRSPAAINSLLQRARATMLARGGAYFLNREEGTE